MNSIPEKYIKVNIPLTEEDYLSGNGEGVWVEVDRKTRKAYDENAIGSGYHGILSNDSIYYPTLRCGMVIPFEMRGEKRPVVDYHSFLSGLKRITAEEKNMLIDMIAMNMMEAARNNVTVEDAGEEEEE